MKVFFVDASCSGIADPESRILFRLRSEILLYEDVIEVGDPSAADVLLVQEKISYKDFRYVDKLVNDAVVFRYLEKLYTINGDDCATGLLRGLYTSLPRSRFDPSRHSIVPFMEYPNEAIFSAQPQHKVPEYLGGWRGNTKSNALRRRLIDALGSDPRFCFETTDSWMNHRQHEKMAYVALIQNSRFSLCPAGWAPVSFRIYESMALGRCPVILADQYVAPLGPDWSAFAVFYPTRKIADLGEYLYQRREEYAALGEKAFMAWEKYFSRSAIIPYFIGSLRRLIQRSGRISRSAELKRWRSLEFHWRNRWTLPQRVLNKMSRWSRLLSDSMA